MDDVRNSVGVFMDRVSSSYDCAQRASFVESRTEGRSQYLVVSLNHLKS